MNKLTFLLASFLAFAFLLNCGLSDKEIAELAGVLASSSSQQALEETSSGSGSTNVQANVDGPSQAITLVSELRESNSVWYRSLTVTGNLRSGSITYSSRPLTSVDATVDISGYIGTSNLLKYVNVLLDSSIQKVQAWATASYTGPRADFEIALGSETTPNTWTKVDASGNMTISFDNNMTGNVRNTPYTFNHKSLGSLTFNKDTVPHYPTGSTQVSGTIKEKDFGATIVFDGSKTAVMTTNKGVVWNIDLDEGDVTKQN